jgi:two-component system, LytTR family, sensor kinase
MPLTRTRSWHALAWALGIMALLGATAITRHHFQMMETSPRPDYHTWGHAFHEEAPHWLFWAIAIPFIYMVVDWVARRHWGWARTVLAHAVFAAFTIVLGTLLRVVWFRETGFGATFVSTAPAQVFTYTAILGGALAYYFSQRYVEREVELSQARLGALRAQLRPHFMFNALNSVAMLVRGGRGPEAVDMIARLSGLLRDSLDDDGGAEVTLEEELALARRYLAIEEIRFADRLQVTMNVVGQAKTVRVPRLILQPIVENAVQHGIGTSAGAGHIEIHARTTGDALVVTVRDDGPGPAASTNGGVGLKNTRERLRAAYGASARLTLEHAPQGGALATLVIPL